MRYMIEIEHPLTGPELAVGPILRASNAPTGSTRPSPQLGGDTDEVLAEHGLSAEEIASLREAGALG
jgi:crotonobetainyl-CoA:carnitine CoA-transferase CaiB-like acyl-CoA transferase